MITHHHKRTGKNSFRLIDSIATNTFLENLREVINTSARSTLVSELSCEYNTENLARDYIFQLREEQKEQISKIKIPKDINSSLNEVNEIEKEISLIKKNRGFKIRSKVFAKSLGGYIQRFMHWLLKKAVMNKGATVGITISLVSAIMGIITYFDIITKVKKGVLTLKNMGDSIVQMGKSLKDTIKSLSFIAYLPATTISWILMITGFLIKVLYWIFSFGLTNRLSLLFLILGFFLKSSIYIDDIVDDSIQTTGNTLYNSGKKLVDVCNKYDIFFSKNKPKTIPDVIKSIAAKPGKIVGKITESVGNTILNTIFYTKAIITIFLIIILIKWIRKF